MERKLLIPLCNNLRYLFLINLTEYFQYVYWTQISAFGKYLSKFKRFWVKSLATSQSRYDNNSEK